MKLFYHILLLLVIINSIALNTCFAQNEYEVINEWENSFKWIKKDGKIGLLDSSNQIIIKPKVDGEIIIIREMILVIHKGKRGVYNLKGQAILSPNYSKIEIKKDYIKYTLEEVTGEKKQGLCDFKGSKLLAKDYCSIKEMRRNTLAVSEDCKHSILIDRTSQQQISKDTFLYLKYEGRNRYAASKDGKNYGLIAPRGKMIIPFQYQRLESIYYNSKTIDSIFIAKADDKYGLINLENKIVLDFIYDKIRYGEFEFPCVKNGKWGLVSRQNEPLIEHKYDKLIMPETPMNCYIVSKEGKYGAVNRDESILIQLQYEHLCLNKNGLFAAKKNNKWGILNQKGEYLSDFVFEFIDCYNDLFRVKLEGNIFYLNSDLNCIQFCPDDEILEQYGLK